jgi:hypothetical protein
MAGKKPRRNAVPLSDIATAVLDPVLRKRAGISMALVQSWDEIAGGRLAAGSRPEKIVWQRRSDADEPFRPATLVVACEGATALRLQHETAEIIGRVNAFLGFAAIGAVRIVQKPVGLQSQRTRPVLRALTGNEERRLASAVEGVEDDGLRAALQALGKSVLASGR